MQALPIDAVLDEIIEGLRHHINGVVVAPPGSGKTTRLPPAMLAAGLPREGRLIVLEPRRLAARAAARRMSAEAGEAVGETVGYQVRFDRKVGPRTRIVVVTEGIFVRMLQNDLLLEGTGAVLFDEFHERSLLSDLALALVRQVQREVRPDLHIVATSATIDPLPISSFLGRCPITVAEGKIHPVEVVHLDAPSRGRTEEAVARAIPTALRQGEGDILVFLPGVGEIRRVKELLSVPSDTRVLPLHGGLGADEQDAALCSGDKRRVVLATNVAETSVTVEGVSTVIDAGLARIPERDPRSGLTRLATTTISLASANQRTGRAGRLGPGRCLRLWTQNQERGLPEADEPEVRRLDLDGAALQLAAWGEPDLEHFEWFEAPPSSSIRAAIRLLQWLGALGPKGITELGRQMARLPLDPRLSAIVIEAARCSYLADGASIAALLSDRDPFDRHRDQRSLDLLERIDALESHARGGATHRLLRPARARAALRARKQIISEAARLAIPATKGRMSREEAVAKAVLAGFPDRLAARRQTDERGVRAIMVGGRGVTVRPELAANVGNLFVCLSVDAGRQGPHSRAVAHLVSDVHEEWLRHDEITEETLVHFDHARSRVVGSRRRIYGRDLMISSADCAVDEATAAIHLAEAAAADPDRALPLRNQEVANTVARIRCLAHWMPSLGMPDLGPSGLASLLPKLCEGCRSFRELQTPGRFLRKLNDLLTWEQRRALEQLAPERITVPSGSKVRITYEPGRPPILPVRIQEMFGLAQTPTVAEGRTTLLLHLLAPNMRPQQVTDDLASFWTNTYPEVRKELRQRYPKHAWPQDPLNAKPQRGAKRKRR